MLRSLNSGVTGLLNHQVRMDVIGNNISNVNTTGYKARRTTFSESFSQLIKGASRSESKAGGTNPMQVGLGVSVGSIDILMGQGNLQNTGRLLDLGIEGNAFFGVSDGVGTYYTRCGAFELDSQGYIILPTNGMVLQGKMADSKGNFPPGTAIGNLQIPLNQQSPAKATTNVTIARNLNSNGEAKGSVSYTQRLLHAADGERSAVTPGGLNGVNDTGRGKHDMSLFSLYDGNGRPFNMKEGDLLTLSFYTDTTYLTKRELSFNITGNAEAVNRLSLPPGTPGSTKDTENGDAYFNASNMNISSLEDLMRAIEHTLNSLSPGNNASVSLVNGKLLIDGVDNDIFGFAIESNNPTSGKVDDCASVALSFSFGAYLGHGIANSQTYTTNGYSGALTVNPLDGFPMGSTNDNAAPINVLLSPISISNAATFPPNSYNYSGGPITVDVGGFPATILAGALIDPLNLGAINTTGGPVNVRIEQSIADGEIIPFGSLNNNGGAVTINVNKLAESGLLLRPAEQYDYLGNILDNFGNEMGLVDGARITFTATIGEDEIDSKPLIFEKNSTLLDDIIMKLRNDLKLPYDYMDKDNNNYLSVGLKTPGLGEDSIPEGSLVIRGLPGESFSIHNLIMAAKNPGGSAINPNNFISTMATTEYRPATNAEVVSTEIAVYDESGAEHSLRFEFTHTGVNGEWIWKAKLGGKEIIDPPGSASGRINFGQDGTLASWLFDNGGSCIEFDPANGSKKMRIRLDAGGPGNWKGLTQQDIESSASAQTQNGYPSGNLLEISIDEFGLIEGAFSNGITKKIAQIFVIDFPNPGGLLDLSDNVYTLSANSGDPIWGTPKRQSTSSIKPGALEMANVDLAAEFTNMITTQRGYQSNSRIITVSDTMLEEAVNLKR